VTGDSCVDSTECPPGIACNTTSGTCGPYCEALRAVDRWCSEDRQCQTGACVAHACQVLPRAVGDECDVGEDDECESGFCNPGESPPVCAELPLELGAACALDAHCDSLVCYYDPDTDESTCHTGLGLGADCSHAQAPPCNPKVAYCDLWDSPTPRCALLRETGAECEVAQQCRGQCEIRHGRWMCTDVAPEDAAVCDGAE
jgi:hypothetical protein